MLAESFKRTKIITTIGPASDSPEIMEQFLMSGVNGFRFNFSHGTQEWHGQSMAQARELAKKLKRPLAIIADLQGPKIRVGILPAAGIELTRGSVVKFQLDADFEATGIIPVQYDISGYVKPEERIFLRDGQIEVEVQTIAAGLITAKVVAPGRLFTKQGMNLPDTDLGGEILTDKDIADMEFAVAQKADYIALSFVQRGQDILNFKERLAKLGSTTPVIVKFETRMAVEHIDEIVATGDVIMVARGDLAVETALESVPTVQRRLIELGQQYKKPVIVATQMLESMIEVPSPTRAEVSDIANATLQGADAVMLSGESAAGKFPVEAVKIMKRVIRYTEANMDRPISYKFGGQAKDNAISAAAIILAGKVEAKAIIAETASGQTARNVASFRPPLPIIMVTDNEQVYNQLAIVWGGKSFFFADPKGASEEVIRLLKAAGNVAVGDALVVASGHHPGITGGTDTVEIKVVQ